MIESVLEVPVKPMPMSSRREIVPVAPAIAPNASERIWSDHAWTSRLPLRTLSKNSDCPSDTSAGLWAGIGPIGTTPHCCINGRSCISSEFSMSEGGPEIEPRSQAVSSASAAHTNRFVMASAPRSRTVAS